MALSYEFIPTAWLGAKLPFVRLTKRCILGEEPIQVNNDIPACLALRPDFVLPGPPRALRDGLHGGGLYIALWM